MYEVVKTNRTNPECAVDSLRGWGSIWAFAGDVKPLSIRPANLLSDILVKDEMLAGLISAKVDVCVQPTQTNRDESAQHNAAHKA